MRCVVSLLVLEAATQFPVHMSSNISFLLHELRDSSLPPTKKKSMKDTRNI